MFVTLKDYKLIESRVSKELYQSLLNLNSLINKESVQTVVPRYSILKNDIQRFEDITTSLPFRNYSNSLSQLPLDSNNLTLKNDIKRNALTLYHKNKKSLELNDMTFSIIKSSKKIIDLFSNKVVSAVGDVLIENIENAVSSKRNVSFYDFRDAYMLRLFAKRISELHKTGGKEAFEKVLSEMKNE